MIVNEVKKIEIEFTTEENTILSKAEDILISLYNTMKENECGYIKNNPNCACNYYDIIELNQVIRFLDDSYGFEEIAK